MTVVTIAEAREQLPELLRRVAAGEQIVIADGEKWVAALAEPPPPPPSAEEIAARQERATAAIREMVKARVEAGFPLLPGSPLWHLLEPESPAA